MFPVRKNKRRRKTRSAGTAGGRKKKKRKGVPSSSSVLDDSERETRRKGREEEEEEDEEEEEEEEEEVSVGRSDPSQGAALLGVQLLCRWKMQEDSWDGSVCERRTFLRRLQKSLKHIAARPRNAKAASFSFALAFLDDIGIPAQIILVT